MAVTIVHQRSSYEKTEVIECRHKIIFSYKYFNSISFPKVLLSLFEKTVCNFETEKNHFRPLSHCAVFECERFILRRIFNFVQGTYSASACILCTLITEVFVNTVHYCIQKMYLTVPRRLFFAALQRIAITSSPNYYQKMRCFTTRKNQEEHGPDVMYSTVSLEKSSKNYSRWENEPNQTSCKRPPPPPAKSNGEYFWRVFHLVIQKPPKLCAVASRHTGSRLLLGFDITHEGVDSFPPNSNWRWSVMCCSYLIWTRSG